MDDKLITAWFQQSIYRSRYAGIPMARKHKINNHEIIMLSDLDIRLKL